MSMREKILLIAVLILLVAISVKSVVFDAYEPMTEIEKEMVEEAQTFIEKRHSGMLYDSHLLSTRIIQVGKTEDDLTKVHYRKYVLFVFPFGDEYRDVE
ncbi:hypothetical protein ISU02_22445 [Fusibacter sp. Q10-2]|uniref:DUF4845 domain-containing protein n=2 Tax=Fusibacter ferrireducens TaxID=2785058 RepID=A0ABR9ZZJ6_9FIRM|nr:hypothetical protein [Fusibacter ferrireducens]